MSWYGPNTCDCPCESLPICIYLQVYKFLCCEVRAFLYVSSSCPIDEIRVNGEIVANPGTFEFGGLPTSSPTINIGEVEVTGVPLTSNNCCGGSGDPFTGTSYGISSIGAPDCTYEIEVDTCGTTYTCSITWCLPRQILILGQTLSAFSPTISCSKETELGTSTRTITNDIGDIVIPEFSVDFCIPNETGITYSLGSWFTTITDDLVIGLNHSTTIVEYDGTLDLVISPYEQCELTSGTTGQNFQILFTGTRTTTTISSLGTFVSTYSATNLLIGAIQVINCNDSFDTYASLIFCENLIDDGTDALACICESEITIPLITSWC